jgi:hypothetical protein
MIGAQFLGEYKRRWMMLEMEGKVEDIEHGIAWITGRELKFSLTIFSGKVSL